MTALALPALQTFSPVGRGVTSEDLLSVLLGFIGDTGIVMRGLVAAELVVGELGRHSCRSMKGAVVRCPNYTKL